MLAATHHLRLPGNEARVGASAEKEEEVAVAAAPPAGGASFLRGVLPPRPLLWPRRTRHRHHRRRRWRPRSRPCASRGGCGS